jgi:hypothetical protein
MFIWTLTNRKKGDLEETMSFPDVRLSRKERPEKELQHCR